jgi:hypothetical protein
MLSVNDNFCLLKMTLRKGHPCRDADKLPSKDTLLQILAHVSCVDSPSAVLPSRGIGRESDDAGAHLPWTFVYIKQTEDCDTMICFYNKLTMSILWPTMPSLHIVKSNQLRKNPPSFVFTFLFGNNSFDGLAGPVVDSLYSKGYVMHRLFCDSKNYHDGVLFFGIYTSIARLTVSARLHKKN